MDNKIALFAAAATLVERFSAIMQSAEIPQAPRVPGSLSEVKSKC